MSTTLSVRALKLAILLAVVAGILVLPKSAYAADDTSVITSGQGIEVADVSADGRYVVFTTGPNLIGPDPVTQTIKMVDTATGKTETVWSRTAYGTVRVLPRISADGRWVVHGGNGGISLYDRVTQKTSYVDTLSVPGVPRDPMISGDGKIVAFTSLVDNWAAYHASLWAFERSTSTFTRIPGPETVVADAYNWVNDISGDGRFVTFSADRTGFVHDRSTGVNSQPIAPDSLDTTMLISADGSRVAFRSNDDVWGGLRSSTKMSLIKQDANISSISGDGRYVLAASWGEGSEQGLFVSDSRGGRVRLTTEIYGGVVSDDGSVVYFASPELLAPGAQKGSMNLYARTLDGSIPPSVGFIDTPGHTFENDIEWLAAEGITKGCNPPANTMFCPNEPVTRGQMAAFLKRALGLSGDFPPFDDTVESVFEADIATLAAAGVTRGCNPPANSRFCPNEVVTRGQMAAFLHRALPDLVTADTGVTLKDISGSVFAADIGWLAATGITKGCNPPTNDRFCPNEPVTRGQMAAFLKRALG